MQPHTVVLFCLELYLDLLAILENCITKINTADATCHQYNNGPLSIRSCDILVILHTGYEHLIASLCLPLLEYLHTNNSIYWKVTWVSHWFWGENNTCRKNIFNVNFTPESRGGIAEWLLPKKKKKNRRCWVYNMGWVSTAEFMKDKESKISWGRAQELDSGHIPTSGWEIKLLKRDVQKGGLRSCNVTARLGEVGNGRS